MAVANLDTNKVRVGYQDKEIVGIVSTALDSTAGGEFTVTNPSEKTVLVIENSDTTNSEQVTIKAPSKPAMGNGSGFPDRRFTIPKAKTVAVMIDALRYMDADTKKIKITGSSDVKVTVVQL